MARRAPWEDIVNAGLEPHAKSSTGQGGRLFVGLLAIGACTFIGAYYVPLYRAHRALNREYRALAEQAEALKAASLSTQSELVRIREERDGLRRERDGAVAAAKACTDHPQGARGQHP